jgi:hypothetical protein
MIIAVDFDGTLAVTDYPTIVRPIRQVIYYCKEKRKQGHTLILWTCREGKVLDEAVQWCKEQGLEFDYINENPPERVAIFGDCRKVYADVYIDDHNYSLCEMLGGWTTND